MSSEETTASPFAALYEWERKGRGGGGGKPKVQVEGKGGGGKLRAGGRSSVRHFHKGHHLAGTRINNIVKVKYVRNNRDSVRHIIQHVDYLEKRERALDEPERKYYTRDGERSRDEVIDTVMRNRGEHAAMFKIILSPKQNELNQVEYTREIMRRFEEKTGIVTDWSLVEHKNTEYHHVHIVMPGRDMSGNSYRLEKDHLDLLRELANEYQYELQDLVYQREKQIELEFGLARDEANVFIKSQRDLRDMKDLGVYRPEIDKQVREGLLTPTNFDDVYFSQQIQRQLMNEVARDFKQLQSELQQAMQTEHPELYPGLVRELQTKEINDAYFQQLKAFHPVEYYTYMHDPTLDRTGVIDRLKQAFPEWFDPIVASLKEQKPELFADYQKPAPTDRQVVDGLTKTSPELFPELSEQIQANQLNLVTFAFLAHEDPELFNKILAQEDVSRQKEMLESARQQHPDQMKNAEQRLAEKFPDIYKWGEKGPSQADIIADLVKTMPELFPQSTVELQRMEIDSVLFERYRQEQPEMANTYELDPQARGMIITLMRVMKPEELEQATDEVREKYPELFQYEHKQPTQMEILQSLLKEKSDLFPQAMLALKNQEIDKAYFERAQQEMPDGLQRYTDNPELDRSELYQVLKNAFPEWRPEIEVQLKDKMPQLFKYEPERSSSDILEELRQASPELFPGLSRQAQDSDKQQDPQSAKIEQLRERLVDEAYFERGRERMPDGLQAYLENSDLDRSYIVKGLRETFPDWAKDIEENLKELHPDLFKPDDKGQTRAERASRKQQEREVTHRIKHAEKEAREDSPENVTKEALLLLALVRYTHQVDREPELDNDDLEQGNTEKGQEDPGKEQADGTDNKRVEQTDEIATDVMVDAEKLKMGENAAALTGFMDSNFIGESVDLEAESRMLWDYQQQIVQQMDEVDIPEPIDPGTVELKDVVCRIGGELKGHEIEQEQDDRGE